MAAQASGNHRIIIGDINITPLTDVFLVLLIIMMLIAPKMEKNRQDIKLPNVAHGSSVAPNNLAVEVTKAGEFFVKSKSIPEQELTTVLKENSASLKEKNVVIRADKSTKSGTVMKILEAARDAGYEKVTVSGEPLSNDRQKQLTEP